MIGIMPGKPQFATESPAEEIADELLDKLPEWSRRRLDAAIEMLSVNLKCLQAMRAGEREQAEKYRRELLKADKRHSEICTEEDGGDEEE
jgi:hypothetical protein